MLDALVIGAGPAGIAAGRAFAAAGAAAELVEARPRAGGRTLSLDIAGKRMDVGARWMHMAEKNPLVPLAKEAGFASRRAPTDRPLYDGGERVPPDRSGLMDEAWERLERKLAEGLRDGDTPLSACMPDLGSWTDMFALDIGLYSGAPVEEASALDFTRIDDGSNRFLAEGYGDLVAHLASPLTIHLDNPALNVRSEADRVIVETRAGAIEARQVLITVPTALLQRGALEFSPMLPADVVAAINAFSRGAYEHVVVSWPDSPFDDNGADQLTFFKSGRDDGAAMLCRIGGSDRHYVELGGPHRSIWNNGAESWKRDFVRRFLKERFGAAADRAEILHLSDWWNDPWCLSSWSVCPAGKTGARTALREHRVGRLRFASEATSLTQWGTVGGAWSEGERAAREMIASF